MNGNFRRAGIWTIKYIEKLVTFLYLLLLILAGISISLMFIFGLVNILLRFFFKSSLFWSQEMTRYLVVWITYFGASLALLRGEHFQVTFFIDNLTEKSQKIVGFVMYVLTLCFLYTWTVENFKYWVSTWGMHAPILENLPLGLVIVAMPISSMCMFVFELYIFLTYIFKRRNKFELEDESIES